MIKILVASGKGGVGKTTISANLGAALSLKDRKVIMIDGDARLRNLDSALGLSQSIVYDATDVLDGRSSLKDAIVSHPLYTNLHLLAAPQNRNYEGSDIAKLCDIAKDRYDICIIDAPAGIDDGFDACAIACEYALVITTPDVSALRDAISAKKQLLNLDFRGIWAILNRQRAAMAKRGGCMDIKDVEELLELHCIGIIKERSKIVKSGNQGVIISKGKIYSSFANIACNLLNAIKEIQDMDI